MQEYWRKLIGHNFGMVVLSIQSTRKPISLAHFKPRPQKVICGVVPRPFITNTVLTESATGLLWMQELLHDLRNLTLKSVSRGLFSVRQCTNYLNHTISSQGKSFSLLVLLFTLEIFIAESTNSWHKVNSNERYPPWKIMMKKFPKLLNQPSSYTGQHWRFRFYTHVVWRRTKKVSNSCIVFFQSCGPPSCFRFAGSEANEWNAGKKLNWVTNGRKQCFSIYYSCWWSSTSIVLYVTSLNFFRWSTPKNT